MTDRKISIWYDNQGDMLEVLWAFREGYFTPTEDDRILKRVDESGEVIGFLIHDVSTLKQPTPLEFELAPEGSESEIGGVTVRQAATELGVSERRVRQLARDGRVRGAVKLGQAWLIPKPVHVAPGARGPIGVARHRR